jgi:hypothetical protein
MEYSQGFVLKRPYRETEHGAVSQTFIYMVTNEEPVELVPVVPAFVELSKTGRHGYMTWKLLPGRYVIVSVSRPNNPNKPYTVDFYCATVEGKITTERVSCMVTHDVSEIIMEIKRVVSYCK